MDLFEKEKSKFELIYIHEFSHNGTPIESEFSMAQFEDKKIIYSKQVGDSPHLPKEITPYTSKTPNKKLVALALQSGEFSRFKRDKNFRNKSYEHLYTKWIQNSTNKKLAFCVLIFGDINEPEGFITVQKKGNDAHVGLFAVNNKARNKGIGKKLMAAS
jgi:dTDP-4-amino-4,6-dideoxy-D-galactose acyltransferase